MNIELEKQKAETKQVKVVFKNHINDHNTLFGGIALKWMDELAYITATRFCRKKVVTISTGKMEVEVLAQDWLEVALDLVKLQE